MKPRTLCRGLFALVAFAAAHAAPPSLVLRDPTGQWKTSVVQRMIAPGVEIEMVVMHPASHERLMVVRSDQPNDTSESLRLFADLLRESFGAYRTGEIVESAADAMGCSGREWRFDLANETETLACDLFVFARGGHPIGVLYVRPKATPPTTSHPFDLLRLRTADDLVILDRYRVTGSPFSTYPISLEVKRSRTTQRVLQITVSEVPPDSETERLGVRPGDHVTRINGRDVEQFKAGLSAESELGQIFIDRPQGEVVRLDLISTDTRKPYSVTLHSGRVLPMKAMEGLR